jgi:isochorismate synthase
MPVFAPVEVSRQFDPHAPFVMARGRSVLRASGARRVGSPEGSWSSQYCGLAAGLAEGDEVPVLVGCLPFDHRRPAHLFQPCGVVRLAGDAVCMAGQREESRGPCAPGPSRWQVTADPPRGEYERNVAQALRLFEQRGLAGETLRKVVLARSLLIRANAPIDVDAVVRRLGSDPSVTVFSVPLPHANGAAPRTLVGATPELLIDKSGSAVASEPLAGSAVRFADPAADRASADGLMQSDKNRREHASVVEWIADRLAPYCRQLTVPKVPSLVSTRFVWHLATRVDGRLHDDQVSSIELAEALHPTPAVCGLPHDAARAAIDRLEAFDRDYFAGAVGWCDRQGDGRWMMTLRCAEISGSRARLYAGAGIVAGSDPEVEAAETSVKFRALLDALGIDEYGHAHMEEL